MEYLNIGNTIKEFRIRKGISQLTLSEGLCEPSTLCKIESGRQNPNKKLLEALVSRLKIPMSLNIPVTKSELQRANIEREINAKISTRLYDILELLDQYKNVDSNMNHLEQQFYLFAKSFYKLKENKDYSKHREELENVLRITYPSYSDESELKNHLFIPIELVILNNIAICFFHLEERSKAIHILEQLEEILSTEWITTEEYSTKVSNQT